MSRVVPYVMRPERQREVRYVRRGHRRPQGPPLGRQAGLYVAARRPRPASPVRTRRSHVLPPQPPAKTNMFAHAPHAPRRRRMRMAGSGAALTGTCFPEQRRLAV